jgi:hypothetical protein
MTQQTDRTGDVFAATIVFRIVHGGCHTRFQMPKPRSGALLHETALEDLELIPKVAASLP